MERKGTEILDEVTRENRVALECSAGRTTTIPAGTTRCSRSSGARLPDPSMRSLPRDEPR